MRHTSILLLFIASFVQSQVSLSLSQLDFGDVLTTADKELAVNVTNTSSGPLVIDDVNLYNTDFTYSIPTATIATGATEKVRVTFSPRHNVAYNTELIFVLDDGSEHRIDLVGNGRYEGTYYSSTFNKSYQDLKDALRTKLAAGYINLGYSGARDKMYDDIDNVAGKVTCVYTGRVATFNTRSGANSNNFNCEHTWPQSLFSQREPERADIHHLFPTDNPANGRRASYPFGVVTGTPTWTEGGSKLRGSVFEPRDLQKGATARAMMYFVIRYQDYSNFIDGQEAILKQWHSDYSPSAFEIQRNGKIFGYQKNRNPFVDHPEFIERINVIGGTDTKPVINEVSTAQKIVNFKYVDPSLERGLYIINTGNQNISNISSVVTRDGNLIVNSIEPTANEGDAAKITLGFKDLADGTYTDELTINLESQVGKTITIPVTFTIGALSTRETVYQKLKTNYNPSSQQITILDAPANIVQVEIWDAAGRQITLDDISSSLTDIPFGGHSQGVYFVLIKTKTEVFTSKVLVY
tara:strand:+ start:2416 stop:3984 length:1569 start_codon:yes stop_codon:yes gene_type:complete